MVGSQVQHKSVALEGRWRILQFGKLNQNPVSHTRDLTVDVFLGRLQDQSGSPIVSGKIEGAREKRSVLVGEIPRLAINSVLLDGRVTGQKIELSGAGRFTRKLNCAKSNIHIFDRLESENGQYIIPLTARSLDEKESRHILFAAFGDWDDPYATIIPVYEIFRFFYATSDVMTKALLSHKFLDPGTHIWNPEKSRIVDGRAMLWLRKRMLDSDARFIARFAFDAYALQCAQSIFLYAASIHAKTGEMRLRAVPPFEDIVSIEALGRCLANNRVLVTQILRCHWRPNFHALHWDRDNDGRYDPDRREERPASEYAHKLFTPSDNTPLDKLIATPPSGQIHPSRIQENEISERFPELGKTPAKKLPQESASTRAKESEWKKIWTDVLEGTVSEGKSSEEMVGTVIIEAKEKKPKLTPSLSPAAANVGIDDSFDHVLHLLAAIKDLGESEVDFLVVSDEYFIHKEVSYNLFPDTINYKRSAWLFSDDDRKYQRMILIAKITHQFRTRYIFELQQRKGSSCSTLIIWNDEETDISEFVLRELLLDCAEAGSAKFNIASSLDIFWNRRRHTTDVNSENAGNAFLAKVFTSDPLRALHGSELINDTGKSSNG